MQAELVGCGDGRKLSCLSPIGKHDYYDDYDDHLDHAVHDDRDDNHDFGPTASIIIIQ